ncbi:MAG TPA: hypothetical protein VFF87_02625 [Hyphomicrobium sp.]|nr:hypothetical protein [Hyphomicrobium sp.]
MAQILSFRTPEFRSADHSAQRHDAVAAEVILFPGVRYERWSEGRASAPPPQADGRRDDRDVLELAE